MELERTSILEDVLPEDYLELSTGKVVKNLRELVVMLEGLSEEDFSLHVYGDQNDFAEWIMEAYWDEKLTGKVLGVRDKGKMVKILKKALKIADRERFVSGKKNDVLNRIGKMG